MTENQKNIIRIAATLLACYIVFEIKESLFGPVMPGGHGIFYAIGGTLPEIAAVIVITCMVLLASTIKKLTTKQWIKKNTAWLSVWAIYALFTLVTFYGRFSMLAAQ